MLQKTICRLDVTSEFFPPADYQRILEAEEALKLRLPDELRSALQETNGLTANYGAWLVWPIERIREANLLFRSKAEFRDLYMPFDHLPFHRRLTQGAADLGHAPRFQAFPLASS